MDQLQKLREQFRRYVLLFGLLQNIFLIGLAIGLQHFLKLPLVPVAVVLLFIGLLLSTILSYRITNFVIEPVNALWQTILHLNPSGPAIAAPRIEDLQAGQELVANLSAQIYQLTTSATQASHDATQIAHDLHHNFIALNLPLPLLILDASENIVFANQATVKYIGISEADLLGKNVYMVLDMLFPSEDTFDQWLKMVKVNKATASTSWERIRLNVRDNHPVRMFDLAAYYNRSNPERHETILVLFDHTKQYSQDDQAISFIALSVHELRTPLTLLRGYIEVFEEELGDKVSSELTSFMEKMRAQADQLTAFVNNILNVARIDDDQLELNLQSANWSQVLKRSIEAFSLRAKVRGVSLHCRIPTDLPPVGVDRLSIQEVITNLLDNAIKYSGDSKRIEVEAHLNGEGLIETTVQDFGLGISTSILPNLFTKFYRDHRNRAQIGGTGLGLYLSKAIITAHGGTIWVRSQEGQGSTFGFTLVPYAKLAEAGKQAGDQEILRGAHGWIKNHSFYRR